MMTHISYNDDTYSITQVHRFYNDTLNVIKIRFFVTQIILHDDTDSIQR